MTKKILLIICLLYLPLQGLFSQMDEDKVKVLMLYNIANYIVWPSSQNITFTIGILGENVNIKEEFLRLSANKKINGKPIVVKQFSNDALLEKTDLLFITNNYNKNIPFIFADLIQSQTLIVTNSLENRLLTMINFTVIKEEDKIAFEVNKQNLTLANFNYKPELLMYGGTEVEIKELLKSTQKTLEKESENVAQLLEENKAIQMKIVAQNNQIANLEVNIQQANNTLKQLNDTIHIQKHSIITRNNLIQSKNNEYLTVTNKLAALSSTINFLSNNINLISDSINYQTDKLRGLNNVIEEKENTINEQSLTIGQKESLLQAERKILLLVAVSSIALLFIGILLFLAFKHKQKSNIILETKVDQRTKELFATNQQLISEIAEKEKSKESLAQSERNYREIFNSTTDAIFIHDAINGKLIDLNDTVFQMYGYKKEQLQNLTVNDFCAGYSPFTAKNALAHLKQAVAKGSILFEWHAKNSNNNLFWVEVSMRSTNIGGKNRVLAIVRDINEKKKISIELDNYRQNLELLVAKRTTELATANTELQTTVGEVNTVNANLKLQKEELQSTLTQLQETQKQLIESDKMASLGTLTAGVAHEINNPLNYIMGGNVGFEEYFEEYGSVEKTKTDLFLNSIKVGIERISGIVQGLNQFSRNNEDLDEDCDLHAILDNCLLMLHNSTHNRLEIVKEYNNNQIITRGNVGKLHQVFINILTNAIQATTNRGEIRIVTNAGPLKTIIEIIDYGIGIEKQDLLRITEPFFTTKQPGEGTGLGLSIAYSIIKDHHGDLEFESEINSGTKVTVTLPIASNMNEN